MQSFLSPEAYACMLVHRHRVCGPRPSASGNSSPLESWTRTGGAWYPCRRRRCPRRAPCRRACRWGRRACSGRVCLPGRPSQRHRPGLVEARSISEGFRTSSGTGSSTVTAIAAREPGSPRPTAMLPMLMPCSPEDAAELPDHAWHVLVADEEHVLLGHDVQVEAHDLDEPGLHPGSHQRPAHRVLAPVVSSLSTTRLV